MKKFAPLVSALLAVAAVAFTGTAFGAAHAGAAPTKEETKKAAPAQAKSPAAFAAAEKKADPMDINTASEKDLATLKGIGDVRAKAIVKGRPYKGKNELVDKKIIPESVYNDIKEQIIAKQPEKKEEKKADAKPKK